MFQILLLVASNGTFKNDKQNNKKVTNPPQELLTDNVYFLKLWSDEQKMIALILLIWFLLGQTRILEWRIVQLVSDIYIKPPKPSYLDRVVK